MGREVPRHTLCAEGASHWADSVSQMPIPGVSEWCTQVEENCKEYGELDSEEQEFLCDEVREDIEELKAQINFCIETVDQLASADEGD